MRLRHVASLVLKMAISNSVLQGIGFDISPKLPLILQCVEDRQLAHKLVIRELEAQS